MSRIFTLIAIVLVCASASAQTTATVKGKLIDSTSKQSLKDATITILDARDSTLEVFGLAQADGSFVINNISFGDMLLQVKFSGYEPISRKLTFSKTNSNVNLGTIYLKQAANDLGNVTVTQSSIQMKKDTMEISASAFKTKPNAVAEDLLKKIPGMEVDKNGNIKSQGEAVQRVLVDGKRFMGDDPRLATRTLPPDVIDKIQVFDDLSDQSKFSGFDDGNRVKTVNITTKKDRKKGMFGKAVAGIGTNDRYDESFNFTRMNGDRQLTLQGQANDVNKQNFTQNNIGGGRNFGGGGGGGGFGGGGGGGGFGGGGGGSTSGITKILAGALNYRDVWSPKVDAYGSYRFDMPKVTTENNNRVEKIFNSDSSTYSNTVSSSIGKNENHRFNFNIEDRIDSNNQLIFRPNFSIQTSNPTSTSSTITTGGKNNAPVYNATSTSSGYNSGFNISGTNLQLRHRFAKRGRTVSLDLGFSASETNGNGNNFSVNSYFKPFVKTDTLNQHYIDSSRSVNFNPTISYTEPIAKNQMIELRYSYNYSHNKTINNTYSFDNAAQKFSRFDSLFSNSYDYTSISSNANLSWRIQQAKFNLNVGSGFQFTDLTSNNLTKNVLVKRNYVNFTPNMNFTYNFTRTKSLRVFYNGRTSQPSTSQLQPIVTSSNTINFQKGNPDLKPSFNNSLRVLFNSFDPFTQRLVFATVNATITGNDIVSSITQTPNGGDTTTYVNLPGTYNLSGYFMYGFPIKNPKSNLNLQTNIDYRRSQSILNKVVNATSSVTYRETIKWTTNLKNNFDMNLSSSFEINPIRSSLSANQNTNYTTATLAADFTLYSNNGWLLASDFDYTHFGNRPAGYNTTVFLITPSIAKSFLKNKAGELRLSCFDVLKQNKAVSSSATANQITNSISNNLTRYFMLTFTYNLRSFGQQQGQQRREGMMPGMMRGMMGGREGGGFNNGGGGGRRND